MKLRIALSGGHGGFVLKNKSMRRRREDYEILDLDAHTFDQVDDYPDFAPAVAQSAVSGQVHRGILICGSGVGACIATNKVPGCPGIPLP